MLTGNTLGEKYGFTSVGMFKCYFYGWNKLKKTKYYYALNGRGAQKGIAEELECTKLADGVILVPINKVEPFRSFLEFWQVEYTYIPTLIPERLNKKKLLG